ncbi:MAG TPA: OsmC family protein [Steroidobacteraceae bacterium]|nr:OsmC family protein [Steroidobacteraceae bacterium]
MLSDDNLEFVYTGARMTTQNVATALLRVESVLQRRPGAGLHDDAPATVRWERGLRVVAGHLNGTQIPTDMPRELGGTGDRVTPGWLMRAGLAACTATSIALRAAARGIELQRLEIVASSRSDTRGLLGMINERGEQVPAGPRDLELTVRIAAQGATAEQLRSLVEDGYRNSPIACALEAAMPVGLRIDIST